jgi:hypothetical protein
MSGMGVAEERRGERAAQRFPFSFSFSFSGSPILILLASSRSRLIALYPPATTGWPSWRPSMISD